MSDDRRLALGLMSGTSLDGVDAAVCRIEGGPSATDYDADVVAAVERPYDRTLRERVRRVCTPNAERGTAEEICRLNVALADSFADAAEAALERAGFDRSDLDAVGSHGQTVWHDPDPRDLPGGGRSRATLQIGDGSRLAERLETEAVTDFRARDVAAGGHGAPLVPLLDLAALVHPEETRAAQNIGGIGNCTFLPPGSDVEDVTAFDTGPGNVVVDGVVELVTDGEHTYDADGEMAARGTVDEALVERFLDDPFFRTAPPRTTGRERFGGDYPREFLAAARERGRSDADAVASATALTARSIADAYERFGPDLDRVAVSGGGVHNPTLMAMLGERIEAPVESAAAHGLDPDAKEGALFALLAVTALDGVPNNVPRATGADRRVVMGARSPAPRTDHD
jgi:anhydro-N-acetylmuramic acid kinase